MVGWQGIGEGFCGQRKQAVFHSIGVPCPYLCILCFAVDRPAHSTFCINSMFNKIGALLGRSFPLVKSVGVVDVGLDHSQAEPGPYSGSTVVPNVPLSPLLFGQVCIRYRAFILWPYTEATNQHHRNITFIKSSSTAVIYRPPVPLPEYCCYKADLEAARR